MKQRERYIVREQTGRKDNGNSRKSMQLNLNFSLTGTWEMVLRPLSILNPEEMDDTELLKDLRGLCKPPLFDGNDTDVSFFPVPEDDSILLRRMDDEVDTGPDEHHRAIGELANQMNQHIGIPQIQYTDKVADDIVAVQRQVSSRTTETKHRIFKLKVNICKQRIFKLIDLAHEITGVKVAQTTWYKLLDDRQHATESSHIAQTKEAVADDTANSNTDITSCVSQTTLGDFSKNLEEPSPTENEEEIDDQTRSMDSHAIQCEKEYWSDLRTDTGTLFFPDKIVM